MDLSFPIPSTVVSSVSSPSDVANKKVETMSSLAHWRTQYFENLNLCSSSFERYDVKSDAFKIGIWNWHLAFGRPEKLKVRLFLEPSSWPIRQPPLARFIVRVTDSNQCRYDSPVEEKVFCNNEEHVFSVNCYIYGRFVIDVEFLDLKISTPNGTETTPLWLSAGWLRSVAAGCIDRKLSILLLQGSIHADITIMTPNGSIKAHKVILAASSPVFSSMFNHDLKENESSTINIEDMSQESCMTFLSYFYGDVKLEDFLEHRIALLGAAIKYDVADLKNVCEESLLEDLNSENVLDRLQEAWFYQLHKMKRGCFRYLFEFGKIYDIQDKLSRFFKDCDHDLTHEMFLEYIRLSKPHL